MDVESLGLDNEELHAIFKSGMQSVREFQDPKPDILITRPDKKTGDLIDIATIEAISIKFGLREGQAATGDPIVTEFSDGEMTIPAHGFIPQRGDIFMWGGQPIEVSKVYPEGLFVVVCEIRMAN